MFLEQFKWKEGEVKIERKSCIDLNFYGRINQWLVLRAPSRVGTLTWASKCTFSSQLVKKGTLVH